MGRNTGIPQGILTVTTTANGEKRVATRKWRVAVVALMAFGLVAAACGGDDSSNSSNTSKTTTATGNGPWGWPGDAKTGYLAPHQPDVNQDGKVVIGVISPGDTHDKGYYESFV